MTYRRPGNTMLIGFVVATLLALAIGVGQMAGWW